VSAQPQILGIVNVTEDSFSDGGLYLASEAALSHARALARSGADIIDLGAAASNPRAQPVPPDTEIGRLALLVETLAQEGVKLSIDSFAPETQSWALERGVDYLNDIHGFAHPELYPQLAAANAKLIVMHALESEGPARRESETPPGLFERIRLFFETRIASLTAAGIARERLILDPGMGLFLGRSRQASFEVLRRLPELKRAFGLPVLISVSRKSFLRPPGRKPSEAGAATLAAELFAARHGVDYIRTHDPVALRDGLSVVRALAEDPAFCDDDPGTMLAENRQGFSAMMQ
jgi:dihydropteroate synthase type 2